MLTHTAIRTDFSRTANNPLPRAHISSGSFFDSISLMGATMPYTRDAEIYGENEPADYVYGVISGAVRTYKILGDGRRQIGAFYLPGDIFGLEADDEHSFSAEAISDAKILVIKRSALLALAERESEVARQLWSVTSQELRRVQDHILLLIKTAKERVGSFLLEMAKRCPSGNDVELPMSRQDIADYLGITIETVSRNLTKLENSASIKVTSARHIVLCNRRALGLLDG
ncbi:MAG: helix-turn-helix domain-containing protein [Pseudolabrys sp.]|jgi:CRP/FNR family nitrogen fixation transcriptional regulator